MNQPIILSILLSLVFTLAGTAQPDTGRQDRQEPSQLRSIGENYRLQARDYVRVEVFQEEDLLRELRISSDGTVTLPLIGKVQVGDLTVLQAQERVEELYEKDFLVDPQVNITVLQYAERRVTVIGQVNQPGPIIIPPEETLFFTQAISAARGITRLGRDYDIQLTRTLNDGRTQTMSIDMGEILNDPKVRDIPLQDGDVILVHERRI